MKNYDELILLSTYDERLKYLQLSGRVGEETFGRDRYLNQILYHTPIWKKIRRDILVRDEGCDLGLKDLPISGLIIIHHMNPITKRDIENRDPIVFDPKYLISCSLVTHNSIHFGCDMSNSPTLDGIRSAGDTMLWRKSK